VYWSSASGSNPALLQKAVAPRVLAVRVVRKTIISSSPAVISSPWDDGAAADALVAGSTIDAVHSSRSSGVVHRSEEQGNLRAIGNSDLGFLDGSNQHCRALSPPREPGTRQCDEQDDVDGELDMTGTNRHFQADGASG
jgi:hypothetical protein